MATLSAAIVKHQVATMGEVEEALARQVLYGGDLTTNLLEAASVSEEKLTQVLGLSHGLGPAPVGELPRTSHATLRLVPADLATRHGVYPLGERPGELILAVAEPLPSEVENDLSFALGVNITQVAAPLVRIRQAVAREYGVPLERRLERLLAKLDGGPPPPSTVAGERRTVSATLNLPRPDSLPPQAYPPNLVLPTRPDEHVSAALDASLLRAPRPHAPPAELAPPPPAPASAEVAPQARAEAEPQAPPPAPPEEDRKATRPSLIAPPPTPVEPAEPTARQSVRPDATRLATLARDSRPPPSQRPRLKVRRGPYTAAMAKEDLERADARDDVLRAFFDFAVQYFEYLAVFAVHGDLAEGWDALGAGADRSAITRIGVPLDVPSSLAATRDAGTWQLGRLEATGIDGNLTRDLERPAGRTVLLLPIMVRTRCVALIYGDHGDENVELAGIGDVLAFAPLVSAALERVILKRKLAARRAVAVHDALETMPSPLVKKRKQELPSPTARATALTQALMAQDARSRPPAAASPAATAPAASAPAASAPPDPNDVPTPAVLPQVRASWTEPYVAVAVIPPVAPRASAPPAAASEPPRARTAPAVAPDGPAIPLTRRTPTPVVPPRTATEPGLFRRETVRGVAPPAATPKPAVTRDDSPVIAIEAEELDSGWQLDDEEVGTDGVPLAPASRSIQHEARALNPRQSSKELRLPSVIVDTDSDAQLLVNRLIAGDEGAAAELIRLGEGALPALVAIFPGPITVEARQVNTAQPSRCGPVLDVLARIGRSVEPYLIVRSADADAQVRAWATRLLGELRGRESARAIATRFTDQDGSVREAALAAARMIQKDGQSSKALRDTLLRTANDENLPTATRLLIVEALSGIRDASSVPLLFPLLADPRPEVVKATKRTLAILTRQELGGDVGRWTEWWDANGKRHRIEWLIDALMHDDQDMRAAAGEELKTLTKEYFGYYEDLPRKERAKAQQRYREWWESRGRAIFG